MQNKELKLVLKADKTVTIKGVKFTIPAGSLVTTRYGKKEFKIDKKLSKKGVLFSYGCYYDAGNLFTMRYVAFTINIKDLKLYKCKTKN